MTDTIEIEGRSYIVMTHGELDWLLDNACSDGANEVYKKYNVYDKKVGLHVVSENRGGVRHDDITEERKFKIEWTEPGEKVVSSALVAALNEKRAWEVARQISNNAPDLVIRRITTITQ